MKNNVFIILLVLLILIVFVGCAKRGSGNIIKEQRNVSNFNSIDLSGSSEAFITQGEKESVIVETDENLISDIITVVKNGELTLSLKNWIWPTTLKYHVTVKDINKVKLSGSGIIKSNNKLITNDMMFNLSGSGNIDISVEADKVQLKLSGSGQIMLTGKSNLNNILLSGSGMINGPDFISQKVIIKLSGSGSCLVNAVEELIVDLSGSGTVKYKGNPKVNS